MIKIKKANKFLRRCKIYGQPLDFDFEVKEVAYKNLLIDLKLSEDEIINPWDTIRDEEENVKKSTDISLLYNKN